jgi:hypothetical protein
MQVLDAAALRATALLMPRICAADACKPLQAIVDKSLGSGITRVIVSPIANKRVQLVVGASAASNVPKFRAHTLLKLLRATYAHYCTV